MRLRMSRVLMKKRQSSVVHSCLRRCSADVLVFVAPTTVLCPY